MAKDRGPKALAHAWNRALWGPALVATLILLGAGQLAPDAEVLHRPVPTLAGCLLAALLGGAYRDREVDLGQRHAWVAAVGANALGGLFLSILVELPSTLVRFPKAGEASVVAGTTVALGVIWVMLLGAQPTKRQ